jgi:hypothetical protein
MQESKQRELDEMALWCRTVMEFLRERAPDDGYADRWLAALEEARQRGSLRGMRMAKRDLVENAEGFSPRDQRELNQWLSERGLELLQFTTPKDATTVAKVMTRGRIRTDNEFRLVLQAVDDMVQSGRPEGEIAAANALLAAFVAPPGSRRRGE